MPFALAPSLRCLRSSTDSQPDASALLLLECPQGSQYQYLTHTHCHEEESASLAPIFRYFRSGDSRAGAGVILRLLADSLR